MAIPTLIWFAGCGAGAKGPYQGSAGDGGGAGAAGGGNPAGNGGAAGSSTGSAGAAPDAAAPDAMAETDGAGGSPVDAASLDLRGDLDTAAGPDASSTGAARTFVYVSGFAAPITTFAFDSATGALSPGSTVSTGVGGEPSTMAFSPDKRFAYAVDEQRQAPLSTLLAYSINQTTGALTEINRQAARGGVPASVAVHADGKWVLSANYGTGNVSVFPVRADGGLGPAMTPVAAGGQAHQIVFDSTHKFVFVPCLTARYIAQFRFADGVLTPNDPARVLVAGGPRHLSFTPDERFAYLLTQGESTVVSFTYDKTTGRLTPLETVPSTPSGTLSAHIKVHPSGKFLYSSNRTDNSITTFTIDSATGRLTRIGYQRDRLIYPWHFGIDPTGQLMIVANNRGASVLVHRIDLTTGMPQPLGAPVAVAANPTFVGFLTLP